MLPGPGVQTDKLQRSEKNILRNLLTDLSTAKTFQFLRVGLVPTDRIEQALF